ncbi:MAG: hypothetical protein ACOCXV_00770 [Bacteroidota bacterium]
MKKAKQLHCKALLFVTITLFTQAVSYGQENSRNSLCIGAGAVYLSQEQSFDPGLHLGYGYEFHIGKTPLSAGASAELIFGDHSHMGFALNLGYSPVAGWDLGIGSGVMFEDHKHFFSVNLATSYGFDFRRFSAGPALELAHTGTHYHLLMGLHIDLDF